MKKGNLFKLFLISALVSLNLSVFADYDLKLVEKGESSVKLAWDSVEDTAYYQVKYEDDNGTYETNILSSDELETEVLGLEAGKSYKFNLVGLDTTGTILYEGDKLDVTLSKSETFSVVKSELIEKNILTIQFSKELDASKINDSDFRIEAVNDSSDYLNIKDVTSVSKDKKSVDIEFDGYPTDGVEYKVTVLSIYNTDGENIRFGVDSETTFVGGEVVKELEKTDLNSGADIDNNQNENKEEEPKTDLNSSGNETKSLSGNTVSKEDKKENVNSAANNSEDLPTTGPEMIIIVILALLLTSGVFFLKNKKA